MKRGALALIFILPGLCAAEGRLRLETTLDPREATVGDPIALSVKVVAEPGVELQPFAPEKTLGSFDVLSFRPDPVVDEQGRRTQTFHWTLAVYEVGVATVPALTFAYQSAGADPGSVRTPELPVTVRSVLNDDSADIRGLKKPWPAPIPWMWLALGALAAGALVFLIRRVWTKKKPALAAPRRPAHETALAALDQLEKDRPASAEVFYLRLSGIARLYLWERYGLPAPDLTTAEIVSAVKPYNIPADARLALRDLLESSDLAKFAKAMPGDEDRLRHTALARAFVHATRVPDAPEEAP